MHVLIRKISFESRPGFLLITHIGQETLTRPTVERLVQENIIPLNHAEIDWKTAETVDEYEVGPGGFEALKVCAVCEAMLAKGPIVVIVGKL